ncbi:MAG: hypothetical protein ACREO7_06350 [Pseudoxanthomonas sp.]
MKPAIFTLLALAAVVALFLLFSRQTSAKSNAQDESGKPTIFVFVKIPEPIMPIDRGGKYEDPLDSSLKQAGFGEVTGGGSQLSEPDKEGARHVEWVGIDVDLTDPTSGLPLLKSELKRLGAPAGTTIEYEINGEKASEAL